MIQRTTDYFTALAVLTALSLLYQTAADYALQPPRVAAVPLAERTALAAGAELDDLFPERSWQLGTCKQLQTRDAVLLFDRLVQGEGDQWTFEPVTVVYGRGLDADASAKPLILEAEKAVIEFSHAIDLESVGTEAAPIHSGKLQGKVRIRSVDRVRDEPTLGHVTPTDVPPRIEIQTTNLSIEGRRIWTTHPITMRFGNAQLNGRDLTLRLAASPGAAGHQAGSMLERMELVYLDDLTIPLDDPSGATLQMNCGGHVDYDFAINKLRLQDSVSFVRRSPGLPDDRFDCTDLKLYLRDPFNRDLPRREPLDWISEVIASGSPHEPVMLNMPTRMVQLAAGRLRLNVAEGLLEAVPLGRGGRAEARPKTVTVSLRYQGVMADFTELQYRFDPLRPRHFGRLLAPGAGRLDFQQPGIPINRLVWSQLLEIRAPDDVSRAGSSAVPPANRESDVAKQATDDTPLVIDDLRVNLDGNVQAWMSDGGRFAAQHVQCDLEMLKSGGGSDDRLGGLLPSRFSAKQGVLIDSSAARVETDELALYFLPPLESGAQPTVPQDSGDTSLRQWVAQPERSHSPKTPVARPRPTIRGPQISAQLQLHEGGVLAKGLSVDGGVHLTHLVTVGDQSLTANLRGQRLGLVHNGSADTLRLLGTPRAPARLELGDGYFVGPSIEVLPSQNVVQINEAGEFRIPTAILPSAAGLNGTQPNARGTANAAISESKAGRSADGELQWTTPPRCRFNGGMRFDGRAADLTGGVTIAASMLHRGTPWDLHLRGDTLRVDFTEGIQLRDMQTLRQASITALNLHNEDDRPVVVEAFSRGVDGKVQSRHLLHSPRLTFAPAEGGQLIGDGPGSYWAWSLGKAEPLHDPVDPRGSPGRSSPKRPRSTREATRLANRARRRDEPAGREQQPETITGLHLRYYDKLHGHLHNQSLDFIRNVRIGSRPVTSWDDSVDVDQMTQVDEGQMTVACDHLRFVIDPATIPNTASVRPSFRSQSRRDGPDWEMLAGGGVLFRTKRDQSRWDVAAGKATYSSAKDTFTLHSVPGRLVRLSVESPGSGPREFTFDVLNLQNIQSGDLTTNSQMRGFTMGQLPDTTGRTQEWNR